MFFLRAQEKASKKAIKDHGGKSVASAKHTPRFVTIELSDSSDSDGEPQCANSAPLCREKKETECITSHAADVPDVTSTGAIVPDAELKNWASISTSRTAADAALSTQSPACSEIATELPAGNIDSSPEVSPGAARLPSEANFNRNVQRIRSSTYSPKPRKEASATTESRDFMSQMDTTSTSTSTSTATITAATASATATATLPHSLPPSSSSSISKSKEKAAADSTQIASDGNESDAEVAGGAIAQQESLNSNPSTNANLPSSEISIPADKEMQIVAEPDAESGLTASSEDYGSLLLGSTAAGDVTAVERTISSLTALEYKAKSSALERRTTDTARRTSLHLAVLQKNREIVRALLTAGADVNTLDAYGYTPLLLCVHWPSSCWDPSVARCLLDYKAEFPEPSSSTTTLRHASSSSSLSNQSGVGAASRRSARAMRRNDSKNEQNVTRAPSLDEAGLRASIATKSIDQIMEALVAASTLSATSIPYPPFSSGDILEHIIRSCDCSELLAALLQRLGCGVKNFAVGIFELSPLHVASLHSASVFTVQYLVEIGCSVSAVNPHFKLAPLHIAAYNGLNDHVRAYLDAGADVNVLGTEARTPLHVAAQAGRTDTVLRLLSRGADCSLRTSDGCSAIECAAMQPSANVIRAISDALEESSLTNPLRKYDEDLNRALEIAIGFCYTDAAVELMARGAKIDDNCNNGSYSLINRLGALLRNNGGILPDEAMSIEITLPQQSSQIAKNRKTTENFGMTGSSHEGQGKSKRVGIPVGSTAHMLLILVDALLNSNGDYDDVALFGEPLQTARQILLRQHDCEDLLERILRALKELDTKYADTVPSSQIQSEFERASKYITSNKCVNTRVLLESIIHTLLVFEAATTDHVAKMTSLANETVEIMKMVESSRSLYKQRETLAKSGDFSSALAAESNWFKQMQEILAAKKKLLRRVEIMVVKHRTLHSRAHAAHLSLINAFDKSEHRLETRISIALRRREVLETFRGRYVSSIRRLGDDWRILLEYATTNKNASPMQRGRTSSYNFGNVSASMSQDEFDCKSLPHNAASGGERTLCTPIPQTKQIESFASKLRRYSSEDNSVPAWLENVLCVFAKFFRQFRRTESFAGLGAAASSRSATELCQQELADALLDWHKSQKLAIIDEEVGVQAQVANALEAHREAICVLRSLMQTVYQKVHRAINSNLVILEGRTAQLCREIPELYREVHSRLCSNIRRCSDYVQETRREIAKTQEERDRAFRMRKVAALELAEADCTRLNSIFESETLRLNRLHEYARTTFNLVTSILEPGEMDTIRAEFKALGLSVGSRKRSFGTDDSTSMSPARAQNIPADSSNFFGSYISDTSRVKRRRVSDNLSTLSEYSTSSEFGEDDMESSDSNDDNYVEKSNAKIRNSAPAPSNGVISKLLAWFWSKDQATPQRSFAGGPQNNCEDNRKITCENCTRSPLSHYFEASDDGKSSSESCDNDFKCSHCEDTECDDDASSYDSSPYFFGTPSRSQLTSTSAKETPSTHTPQLDFEEDCSYSKTRN